MIPAEQGYGADISPPPYDARNRDRQGEGNISARTGFARRGHLG